MLKHSTSMSITYSCNYNANRTQIFTLMCEQLHTSATPCNSIPKEFVSGFVHQLARSWYRVNDILFITAMDIWASCETHNSSFCYFFFLFVVFFPSFGMPESKSSVKQKQTLNKMKSERFLNFNGKNRVLFAIVWIWVGRFFDRLLCP